MRQVQGGVWHKQAHFGRQSGTHRQITFRVKGTSASALLTFYSLSYQAAIDNK
jgi:hypothetical protein